MVHRNKGLKLNNDMCVNTLLRKSSLMCMTYSYIFQVVAVAQVEVADEVAAVVLWITVGRLHTHRTHLEGAREHTKS